MWHAIFVGTVDTAGDMCLSGCASASVAFCCVSISQWHGCFCIKCSDYQLQSLAHALIAGIVVELHVAAITCLWSCQVV